MASGNSAENIEFVDIKPPAPPVHLDASSASMIPGRIDLPTFIRTNVRLWLVQVAQRLAMYRITSESSRYSYVSSSLPPEVAERVADFLFSPPNEEQYSRLRGLILKEYMDSENARITKLLEQCELGDDRPLVLLRKMRSLAQQEESDNFILNRFMKCLPEHVAVIIAATGVTDLDKAADAADEAIEHTHGRGVAAVGIAKPPSAPEPTIRDLQAQIASLTDSVRRLTDSQSRRRSRSRKRGQSPHPRGRSESRDSNLCWYHNTFSEKATKCREPCSWSSSSKA